MPYRAAYGIIYQKEQGISAVRDAKAMAIIDTEQNVVVIRIVFDGSPLSGKTTTVYALRDALTPTTDVFPPDGDADTTLYFDWLEYTGGQFQQMPITCQILSTPSDPDLHARREYLLNTADVVIFVVDATETDQQTALSYYADMQAIQAQKHFKTLVLANKQDKKDTAISDELAYLYQADDDTKMIQASALKNRGIREAFVSAVRLASERVETLLMEGNDLSQDPQEKTPEALLETLQQLEANETSDIYLSTSQLEALADLDEEPILDATTPQTSEPDLTDTQLEALADLDNEAILPEIDTVETKPANSDNEEVLPETVETQPAEFDNDEILPEIDAVATKPVDLDNDEILPEIDAVETQPTDSTFPEAELDTEESSLIAAADLPDDPIEELSNAEDTIDTAKRLPRFPDDETPYQWIYPPILGRNILAKSDFQRGLRPNLDDAMWVINLDGQWRCFSNVEWEYPSEQAAREALREQTAWHVQCNPLLVKQRCVAIAQERKTWRLWQITQAQTNLAQQLTEALLLTDINQLVVETFTCATGYLDAYQELAQLPFQFQVQLDNVEIHEKQIAYLGVIYGAKSRPVDNYLGSNEAIKQILKQNFEPIVQQAVHSEDLDVEAIVLELETVQTQDDNLIVVEALTELFVDAI